MTHEQRVRNLQRLGYSSQQGDFLAMAGMLSGFFMRRQYRAFAGSRGNGPATRLARRVLASGHAWTREFPGRLLLYQLCSRQFYRALGEEDSPHRRRKRRMPYIQRRVFALDFVLAHMKRQRRYLYTQDEKIDACLSRGAHDLTLPWRAYQFGSAAKEHRRCFADRFPMYVAQDGVLCFSFIHCAEEVAIESFKTHLMHYEPLFRSLDRFRLWGVSTDRRVLEKMRVFAGDYLEGAEYDQRVEHYQLEKLFRQERIAEMGQKGLDRLRDLRHAYSERTGQWRPAENKPLPGTFHPYLLRHSYKALATLIPHWWN
ncbi:MAG TPA: hypothetical protein VLU25_19780 [Acidobacteriota bacterium]|nr:hypothetical protein [Acidobacteriota bacterium]